MSNEISLSEVCIDKFSKYIVFEYLHEYDYKRFSEYFKPGLHQFQVNLSEKFIQKYADKVNWSAILTFQKSISPEFKEKHKDKDKRKMYMNKYAYEGYLSSLYY